jgi:hypothetical protein
VWRKLGWCVPQLLRKLYVRKDKYCVARGRRWSSSSSGEPLALVNSFALLDLDGWQK